MCAVWRTCFDRRWGALHWRVHVQVKLDLSENLSIISFSGELVAKHDAHVTCIVIVLIGFIICISLL